MKRSVISIFITMILFVSMFCGIAHATTVGSCTVYVDDKASLLTQSEMESLLSIVGGYWMDYDVNVVLVTVDNTNGKSTMTWSDDYLDRKFPTEENNIGLIIDVDNREIYVNTMGVCISKITDSELNKILDKGFSYVSDADYDGCLQTMAKYSALAMESSGNDIGGSSGIGNYTGHANGVGFVDYMIGSSVLAAMFAGLLGVVLFMAHNSANKKQSAVVYVSRENYKILYKNANKISHYQTRHYSPKSSGSSGGSGGGSSHRSSGGRSHGGGGRKF